MSSTVQSLKTFWSAVHWIYGHRTHRYWGLTLIIFSIPLLIVPFPLIFLISLLKIPLSVLITRCSKISYRSLWLITVNLWPFFNLLSHLTLFEDQCCVNSCYWDEWAHSLGILGWRIKHKFLTLTAATLDPTTSCSALSTSDTGTLVHSVLFTYFLHHCLKSLSSPSFSHLKGPSAFGLFHSSALVFFFFLEILLMLLFSSLFAWTDE